MFRVALKGIPPGSPALDAPPSELVALWRARPPDEKQRELRHALACAKHVIELRGTKGQKRQLAACFHRPTLWLVRFPDEEGEAELESIVVREWETGSPDTPAYDPPSGDTLRAFLGRLTEKALYCANMRELHRITLTLEGSVVVPREKRPRIIREEDHGAWIALCAGSNN